MQRILLALLTFGFAATGAAAPVPPAVRAEIDGLMARLEVSACEFNRNGTWHSAAVAKSHLLRKLQYLEDRNAVQSTEQFIEQAAAKSSVTGQPYMVKCANAAPVPSATWLSSQLRIMRSAEQGKSAR